MIPSLSRGEKGKGRKKGNLHPFPTLLVRKRTQGEIKPSTNILPGGRKVVLPKKRKKKRRFPQILSSLTEEGGEMDNHRGESVQEKRKRGGN